VQRIKLKRSQRKENHFGELPLPCSIGHEGGEGNGRATSLAYSRRKRITKADRENLRYTCLPAPRPENRKAEHRGSLISVWEQTGESREGSKESDSSQGPRIYPNKTGGQEQVQNNFSERGKQNGA